MAAASELDPALKASIQKAYVNSNLGVLDTTASSRLTPVASASAPTSQTASVGASTLGKPSEVSGNGTASDDASPLRGGAEEQMRMAPTVAILVILFVPSVLSIVMFSPIGIGLKVMNEMARPSNSTMGNLAAFVLFLWLALLYMFDAERSLICVIPGGIVAVVIAVCAACLKSFANPHAPTFCLLIVGPIGLFLIRFKWCRKVSQRSFYKAVGSSGLFCVLVCGAIFGAFVAASGGWNRDVKDEIIAECDDIYKNAYSERALDYVLDCGDNRSTTRLGEDETKLALIDKACILAASVWFTSWMVPFICLLCNLVISVFAVSLMGFGDKDVNVQKALQNKLGFLVFMVMGMYTSIYVSGASVQLSGALMTFFAAGFAMLVVYITVELDADKLRELASKSKIAFYMGKAFKSDWIRALMIGGLNLLMPLLFILDMCKQKLRTCRGTTMTNDSYTEPMRRIVDGLSTWNWCSIFVKVNLLGELFLILQLGMKMTNVFFSWLNVQLAPIELSIVILLVFAIGFFMFLLPPVPGTAVYLFTGIVIGTLSQGADSVGLPAGITIACCVGLVSKLCACCGQWGIGYAAGRSVKVQKMIGVDTVPTRAIEAILKQRGLAIGKVAVLVGGPDWPTSVTCGILKLNIPQMLLGTLPVFITSIVPQTAMGAMLTLGDVKEGSPVAMLNTTCSGVAAVGQAAASLMAVHKITKMIEQDGEKLAEPRPEHEAVAELTRRDQAWVKSYREAADWHKISECQRAVLIASVSVQLSAFFILASDMVLSDPLCFRKFKITDRIEDKIENGGLDGSVSNIIMMPMGWVAIGLVLTGVVLHYYHNKDMARLAKSRLPPQDKE